MKRLSNADGEFVDVPTVASEIFHDHMVAIHVLEGESSVLEPPCLRLRGHVLQSKRKDGMCIVSCGGMLSRVRGDLHEGECVFLGVTTCEGAKTVERRRSTRNKLQK